MPTKTPLVIQSQTQSQAAQRAIRVFYDQHRTTRFADLPGRPWWTWVEIPADGLQLPMPCTALTPGGQHDDGRELHWEAPFYPDMKYADFARSPYGQFKWAYGAMRSDDQAATELFYRAGARIAATRGWEIPEPGKPVPFAISVVLGDEPRSPLIARALMAGNPWLLGLTLDPDDDVLPGLIRKLAGGLGWEPAASATDVVAMAPKDLDRLVAAAVEKALAAQAPRHVAAPRREPEDRRGRTRSSNQAEYLAFFQRESAAGHTMTEVARLWRELKAARAEARA